MKRFRTGRPAPQSAGVQTGPMAPTRINDPGEWIDTPHIVKVIPIACDGRDQENPAAALTRGVRKDRSNIVYPSSGQRESVTKQQSLPGCAKYRKRRNFLKIEQGGNSTRGHNHLPCGGSRKYRRLDDILGGLQP
jgi:hypothetical protein